jgi:hypothetical protein
MHPPHIRIGKAVTIHALGIELHMSLAGILLSLFFMQSTLCK